MPRMFRKTHRGTASRQEKMVEATLVPANIIYSPNYVNIYEITRFVVETRTPLNRSLFAHIRC